MESTSAATLQKKKINKGKLKKTIKNILFRPDPEYWPCLTKEENENVLVVLSKYKVDVPEFKKPLWNDIKSLPKAQRPKPPKIKKVEGLLFGITRCLAAVQNGECSAIAIEAGVNPRTIVQGVLESCINKRVPSVCVEGLRKTTAEYFGIPTSCLGVQKDHLPELTKAFARLGENKLPEPIKAHQDSKIEIQSKKKVDPKDDKKDTEFQYLYRTSKKSRIFVPPANETLKQEAKRFKGQDFIEFSEKQEQTPKPAFKKMVVKRISNNPNRVKVK